MPANLTSEAKAKWAKVREAKTIEEKEEALREFISAVPKHKGTKNLLNWAKRRLAELREEQEERKKVGRGPSFFIEKEGAAQVVMLGLTNVGKSLLLSGLSNAKPEASDYPYTTRFPVPGMPKYEDIRLQLIEAPALMSGIVWETKVLALARNADSLMIVIDLSRDPIWQLNVILSELSKANILVRRPRGQVMIERRGKGIKVVIYGKLIGCTVNDIFRLLKGYRIYDAIVKVSGKVTLDDVEKAIFGNVLYKPAIIVANKADVKGAIENYEKLKEAITEDLPIIPVSALENRGLKDICEAIFRKLDLIRVYTKQPNEKPSSTPLALKKGSTVHDVAGQIHRDFIDRFKYAKVWGHSAKYPGMRVGPEHRLEDGDVVEIHLKR